MGTCSLTCISVRFVRHHHNNDATATIGMTLRTESVDFGVIEAESDGRIAGFREKPKMDYLVSMGIYVFTAAGD